ncbi:MAG: response regulator, partial [Myxococcota bacterium]
DAALNRLRELPPVDMVVSDVVMPKMGGLDLRQALRREGIEVPMLFISGYPAHPGQSSAPFPPELPLLRKPFNAQALRRLVRRMLGRNQDTPPPFDIASSKKA